MTTKFSTDRINKEIIGIWKKYKNELEKFCSWEKQKDKTKICPLCPLLFPDIKKNSLLFIGLNPSFTEETIKLAEKINMVEEDFLYPLGKDYLKKAKEFEKLAQNEHRYFSKFKEIAKYVGLEKEWDHIDLFFYRLTSQKEFKKIFDYNKNEFKFNDFGENQLKISLELIKFAEPKIIVVANALSSEIIKNRFNVDESHFKDKGYDYLKLKGKKVPIFFTSMLTGQRQLDKGSLRRLKWQIGGAVKNG